MRERKIMEDKRRMEEKMAREEEKKDKELKAKIKQTEEKLQRRRVCCLLCERQRIIASHNVMPCARSNTLNALQIYFCMALSVTVAYNTYFKRRCYLASARPMSGIGTACLALDPKNAPHLPGLCNWLASCIQ